LRNWRRVIEAETMDRDWLMKLVSPWEYRHAQLFARLRIAAGVWLLVLTAILYGYHRGGWWRALLVPAAILSFYAAYRLPRAIRARQDAAEMDGSVEHRRRFR
jgi:hypothetical protein